MLSLSTRGDSLPWILNSGLLPLKVAVSTQEVIQRHTVKVHDVTPPESILDLGLPGC